MLEIEQAKAQILAQLSPKTRSEHVNLNAALNRVLAEDVHAAIDVPPADNSAMDGYAINTQAINTRSILFMATLANCHTTSKRPWLA